MESVESPLDVLSRAATMLQHYPHHTHHPGGSDSDSFGSPSTASGCESEGDRNVSPRAPAPPPPPPPPPSAPHAPAPKQLPSAAWRRERRSGRLPDYKPRDNGNKALRSQSFQERRPGGAPGRPAPGRSAPGRSATRSDGESADEEDASAGARGAPPDYPGEAPIDMRLKSRPGPPAYPLNRPSVITHSPTSAATGSMSMCDPVIDEHFRRSLGDDYMALFKKTAQEPGKKITKDRGSSPIMFPSDPCVNFLEKDKIKANEVVEEQEKPPVAPNDTHKQDVEIQNGSVEKRVRDRKEVICEDVEMELDSASSSVDDHFAKALGDTWRKIQISRNLMQQKEEEGDKLRQGVVI